ncbi:4-aminobutyrate--2-oxoglutarate transaminase [Deinococcus roseus]|uniref:4-aminobutyrate transaminase n=1 Tax=Deinococcus roseus TaxID=392414 RepID=A0ABQ2CYX7_9DEIO|nr:4-aminobutyrate--2-oxoglutarate transaminase [Deinococcus roseus]GGJ29973.1 4-aminobutyrate transaminase [Deinococcus roseus]
MTRAESRTQHLLDLRTQHIPRGVSNAHPIFAARAEGAKLWDVDGKEYLDFVGGIGVQNVGHSHPRVVQAVQAQLERYSHTCFQVAMYEPYIKLAERLNALAPGDFQKKTIFLTTGAEAVENAVKIARSYTGRPAIISLTSSFHGRTLLGMSLTGKAAYYKQNFGPYAPEVYHAPVPHAYRGWDAEKALEALKELFQTTIDPSRIAAILFEPVLGEGGFIPIPETYLQGLRKLADQYGFLLIADEVQTGFGRTGKMFAMEHSSVVPDLITVAKSLAGGLPLSGVIGRAEVMDAPAPGGLGGTYAGNPLACAAGLAVLDILEEDGLSQAAALGSLIQEEFHRLAEKHAFIGEVRGIGAMMALEIVQNRERRTPDAALTQRIVEIAREKGLLLLKAGMHGSVIRVLVPVTANLSDVQRGLNLLDEAMMAASGVI